MTTDTEKPPTEREASQHNLIPLWMGELWRTAPTSNRPMALEKGTNATDGVKIFT